MPKKRRSDGKGNVHPTDMPDRFKWTCKKCKPPTVIGGATKRDVQLAANMHIALIH